MKFQIGETLTFNNTRYHIQERLGRGAVSDVYLALLNGIDDARVVLKVVRDDAADDMLKSEALQREADVLKILNPAEDSAWARLPDAPARYERAQETVQQRCVIALLDAGDIAPGQPLVVQEIAPPAFARFDVTGPTDERRVLSVAQAVVEVLALVHRNGLALKDFEPATKGDRLRVQWLDEDRVDFTFKMIDWNITGGPEAMSQDLFFFGGHLYYLLTGRHVPVDAEGRPPANLSLGNPAWEMLTAGSRQLIAKLLHRDPQRRYLDVDTLAADLAWWNDILAQIESPSVFRRLDDRLWQARPAGRYDRVLAIADLALRLNPTSDARKSFEQSYKQAFDELDKENWQPIAHAQVTMGTRAYEKAALEFAQQLKILPPESEAARLARIYQLLAGVGSLLKQHYRGSDERRSPEWEALETRAIKALVERRWLDAQSALAEVTRLQPEARGWQTLKDLIDWADSGVTYIREVSPALMDAENRADPVGDAWLETEAEKLAAYATSVAHLEQVQQNAPFEPEFKERLELERVQLKARQTFFDLYTRASELQQQGKARREEAEKADRSRQYAAAAEAYQSAGQAFADARRLLEEIVHTDATQRRAQLYTRRMQTYLEQATSAQQQAVALHQAQQDLRAGRYENALSQTQAALDLAPGREDALSLAAEIQQQQQTALLQHAQSQIAAGRYAEAKGPIQQVLRHAPDHQRAQAMDIEVDMGIQLLEQVRIHMQSATTYLNNEDFDQAMEQLRRFENWDGRALRDLPGGPALPDAVSVRPFHLLSDLRTEAGALRQKIENTRENRARQAQDTEAARAEVQKAWDVGDFATVAGECESLERDYPLPDDLAKKRADAQHYLENEKSARALIDAARDFPDLREAMRVLGDDWGRVAEDLRRRAAERWRLLCQALVDTDLAATTERLREGQRLFAAQAEARFAKMVELAERTKTVAERLETPEDARPSWFALSDWNDTLARLAEDLTVLQGRESWPELRQQAAAGHARLLQYLDGFVEVWLAEIRARAQDRNFTAAHEDLNTVWEEIPTTLRESLPGAVREDVLSLRAALSDRLRAGQRFAEIFKRLSASSTPGTAASQDPDVTYSFQEARLEVAEVRLPEHPDVPVNDLLAARADVDQAATMESVLGLQPVPDLEPEGGRRNYAQLIHTCRGLAEARFDVLMSVSDGLRGRAEALGYRLHDAAHATARKLRAALKEAVEEQQQHVTAEPRRVLELYHQAWWEQSVALASQASEQMRQAHELPKVTLRAAAAQLAALQDLSGFREAKERLARAEKLNNELAYLPLEKLPPLPEDVRPIEVGTKWRIAAGSLNTLKSEIAVLEKLVRAAAQVEVGAPDTVPETNPELAGLPEGDGEVAPQPSAPLYHYDAEQVRVLHALARDVQGSVKRLRDLWQALQLPWDDHTGLAQLGQEAALLDTVARVLNDAQRLQANQEAMQGLDLLYKELEDQDWVQRLDAGGPLLAQPRQALRVQVNALRQALIASLGQQIAVILDQPNAVAELQGQILRVPQSRWLGEAAYQAIRQGVDARARQAEAEGRRDTARHLWEVVRDATAPWATEAQGTSKKRKKSRKARGQAAPAAGNAAGGVTARPSEGPAKSTGAARPPLRPPTSSEGA